MGLDDDGDPEAPWTGAGDWLWGLTDLWFLELTPTSGRVAEALLHSPGEVDPDGDADFQISVYNGHLTARIFKIDLGEHPPTPGRRAVTDVSAWKHDLEAEVQMEKVTGRFAVGPDVGLDWDPARPFQDDETTPGSQWWVAAHKYLFSWPIQFGSDGAFGQFDAPWDPYWS